MTFYMKMGAVPHKRHTAFRRAGGALLHEELLSLEGFASAQALLYHLRPPTRLKRAEALGPAEPSWEPAGALRPRHLRTAAAPAGGDAVAARLPLFGNDDVLVSVARPTAPMAYWYRFAHGDEVTFVHAGGGVLETQFGRLRYRRGDYLVVPTGVLWRLLPDEGVPQRLLVVEARGHVAPPARYRSRTGQFLEHAPFCERDLRPPDELVTFDEEGEFELRVKARGQIHRHVLAHHPLDVVGWDGHLWPYAFNIEDFEPITGRVHQPPPVHQTFEGPGFVVCSFVPRLFDYHPEAIPAPYNHANVDSDEVLYYAEGEFMSRKGIEQASITVHPNGLPHGPHPGTYEGSIGRKETRELAVMIDTFRPLRFTAQAAALEDESYLTSWL
jgi:homogentisate 1,2-dioxygenase